MVAVTVVHMDDYFGPGNPNPRPVWLGEPDEWITGGPWLYPMIVPASDPVTVVRRVDEYLVEYVPSSWVAQDDAGCVHVLVTHRSNEWDIDIALRTARAWWAAYVCDPANAFPPEMNIEMIERAVWVLLCGGRVDHVRTLAWYEAKRFPERV